MPAQATESVRLRLIYDGIGPVKWCRDPRAFGVQDKAGMLHAGAAGPNGTVVFELSFQAKSNGSELPVLSGAFAHGPPGGRFIYLGWRDAQGGFAQRLKLALGTITWSDVRDASARQQPLVGTLLDRHPKATSTGANIGGSRPITWKPT
jgi:hypothetical protein